MMDDSYPATMRAIVLDAPGPPDALQLRTLPVPTPRPGWVLVKVKAFGLNRSELHTRLGLAQGVTFPRVLGIEATGTVTACPGGEYAEGQQVMALMGGMGRVFDGGYAEYTCVPASQIVPFASTLDWAILGAVPEMLQTAYGSLTVGLDVRPGQSLLVRGGTSSVGMTTAILAKRLGMTVLATTRNPAKTDALTAAGVDHVVIDDGHIAPQARRLLGGGVDAALELVGTPTLPDTLPRNQDPRDRVLHRDAVEPVDRQGLLPHRIHPPGCPSHFLWRRRRRPATRHSPDVPRRCRCRDNRRTHRPRLLHRTDRCGPHHHGGRHRHREDRRHHLKAPAELQTPVHPRSQRY